MTGSGRARRIQRHRPLTDPCLKVAASGFRAAFSSKNGVHSLQVSKRRCLHAAATIGLQQFHAASPASSHAVAVRHLMPKLIMPRYEREVKQSVPFF